MAEFIFCHWYTIVEVIEPPPRVIVTPSSTVTTITMAVSYSVATTMATLSSAINSPMMTSTGVPLADEGISDELIVIIVVWGFVFTAVLVLTAALGVQACMVTSCVDIITSL